LGLHGGVRIGGYTFPMKAIVWLLVFGILAGLAYWIWVSRRRWEERKRASEERFASFMAQTMKPAAKAPPAAAAAPTVPAVPAAPAADAGAQKLLFDAAAKAGEAGEAALSIQLYARLIVRFPDSVLAPQARAAVEAQKARLARR
jgi:hypothetical protein